MLNVPITAGCAPVAGEFFCYKVQTGDSVWAIGAMFNLPWGELCAYNQLANCSSRSPLSAAPARSDGGWGNEDDDIVD